MRDGVLAVEMRNQGSRPVQLSVYAPTFYSAHLVPSAGSVSTSVAVGERYDVSVHGPNGFLCRFSGAGQDTVQIALTRGGTGNKPALGWTIGNKGTSPARIRLNDALGSDSPRVVTIEPGTTRTETADPTNAFGWYDLTFSLEEDPSFLRRFTGHLEDGRPSRTHPGAPIVLR
jgi:phospholipase C